jgi:hypothetical protein
MNPYPDDLRRERMVMPPPAHGSEAFITLLRFRFRGSGMRAGLVYPQDH